ncbi:MAG: SAM-dependent methyltransferase [Anaerolineaceae bacterium]
MSAIAYKVIQPEKVEFISYPYEWAFSQLKDAALQTLRIQNIALQAGMILKDASAYNIQFQHGSPILIDTLSFTKYREGQPWVAYRQFCQHFVAPLALMSLTDIRLNKLLQIYIDGIPLDLASKLLPPFSRLKGGILTHIHLHATAQKRYAKPTEALSKRSVRVSKEAMIGLTDSLVNTVKKLTWKASGSDWAEYYRSTNYSPEAFKLKKQIVHDLIHELAPKSIWDLGANTGEFSRLGQDIEGCQIISTDIDVGAVELNYRECKKSQIKNILPLVIDLTNPSPAIGWANSERQSFFQRAPADLLLALALIHHIAISNNVPLQDIAQTCASLGNNLIIEFVPKEDNQVKKLLASRDDIFHDYSNEGFLQAFMQYFTLQKQIPIPETYRTIYWFSKN